MYKDLSSELSTIRNEENSESEGQPLPCSGVLGPSGDPSQSPKGSMTKRCRFCRTPLCRLGWSPYSGSTGPVHQRRAPKRTAIRTSRVGSPRPRPLGKPAGAPPPPTRRTLALGGGGASAQRSRRGPSHLPPGAPRAGLALAAPAPGAHPRVPRRGRRIPPQGQGGAWRPPAPLPRGGLGRPSTPPPRWALAPRPHQPCPARRGATSARPGLRRPRPTCNPSARSGHGAAGAAAAAAAGQARRPPRGDAVPQLPRSAGARHPAGAAARRSACRRVRLPPGRGACGRGGGGSGLFARGFFFFFLFFFQIRVVFAAGAATARRAAGREGPGRRCGGRREREGRCQQVPSPAAAGSRSPSNSWVLLRRRRSWSRPDPGHGRAPGAGHTRGTRKDTA